MLDNGIDEHNMLKKLNPQEEDRQKIIKIRNAAHIQLFGKRKGNPTTC